MSHRTRDRRRREDERTADRMHAEHGIDVHCPHCRRPRAAARLADREHDVMLAGPDHPFLGALRALRVDVAQDSWVAWCGHCGCFAAVDDDHEHGPHRP